MSSWIEERLGRKIAYRQVTEFYRGTGTQKLNLNLRPVYAVLNGLPAITVCEDEQAFYGSAPGAFDLSDNLVWGTDFCLRIDQPDGNTSRCGTLLRINDVWPRPPQRKTGLLSPFVGEDLGSLKITYTGGYTVDGLPAVFRLATNLLIAKLRQLLPLGFLLNSESYQDRSVSYHIPQKRQLLAEWESMVGSQRNWKW